MTSPSIPMKTVLAISLLSRSHALLGVHRCPFVRNTALAASRTATFGAGCFWAPAESLAKLEGVTDTAAGYTGRKDVASPPSYDSVCYGRDWVEAVRVTYDDDVVRYEELLEAFFERQASVVGSRQYGSFVFPADGEQERVAREWLAAGEAAGRRNGNGFDVRNTRIEDPTRFFRAEEYHQNYWPKLRAKAAAALVLLAISSGVGGFVPAEFEDQVFTVTNGLVLAGVLYTFLERKLDKSVVEM